MIRKSVLIILMMILTSVTFGYFVYLSSQNNKVCDELVIMNDGSQIEATEVTSYENGMSTIEMCDDTQMRTPTINIKFIKHIEK